MNLPSGGLKNFSIYSTFQPWAPVNIKYYYSQKQFIPDLKRSVSSKGTKFMDNFFNIYLSCANLMHLDMVDWPS